MNISFTEFTKSNGIMTKIISPRADGGILKDGKQCRMTEGTARTVRIPFSEFPAFLGTLSHNQAISLGVNPHADICRIVCSRYHAAQPDTFTRSNDNYVWPGNNALILIDVDDLPDGKNPVKILGELFPGFRDCAMVISHSVSSNIYNGTECLSPSGGLHIYVPVSDPDAICDLRDALFIRSWFSGYGFIKLSSVGAMLVRSEVFDASVFSSGRLIFEANPILKGGLTQNRPEPLFRDGSVLDLSAMPPLTAAERSDYDAIIRAEKAIYKPEAEEKGKAWDRKTAAKLGMSESKAAMIRSDRKLPPNFMLITDDFGEMAFGDLGKEHDGCSMADPLEPTRTNHAKFYWNDGIRPIINSFSHGGIVYTKLSGGGSGPVLSPEMGALVKSEPAAVAVPAPVTEIPENFETDLIEKTKADAGYPYETDILKAVMAIATDKPRWQRLRSELKKITGFSITNYEKELFPKTDGQKTDGIIGAIRKAGWNFAVNDLDDSVECNGNRMSDTEEAKIWCYCNDAGICDWGKDKLKNVLLKAADENRYNPIKDYLSGLTWDGKDHIRTFCDFFRTDADVVYPDGTKAAVHEVFIKKWIVGAVAKVFDGYQNPALVFSGAQELGKSHAAKWLCSDIPKYFIEHGLFGDAKDLDIYQAAKFIWEISELDATTRKADVAEIKARISKGQIDVRPPYGRYSILKQAAASFIATVNSDDFLVDGSGNRRFLCMTLTGIDWKYSEILEPGQIWAQAVHLFRNGFDCRLNGAEKNFRAEANTGFMRESPLDSYISKFFEITGDKTDFMTFAGICDHLKLNGVDLLPNTPNSKAVRASMTGHGCNSAKKRIRKGGKQTRGYTGIRPAGVRDTETDAETEGKRNKI